jgi:hypothetical protein
LKSLIEAISKNGLECGTGSNFDEAQMKFIFENTLNKYTDTKFVVREDGDIEVIPPGVINIPETSDQGSTATTGTEDTPSATEQTNEQIDLGAGVGPINTSSEDLPSQQKPVRSGIISKNCLKDLTAEQLSDARKWIAEYERKSQ